MKPSHFYFDDSILERERILFNHARYLGHQHLVQELGNYSVIPQDEDGRFLIKTKNGVECVSNVCRHRQASILKRSGSVSNIVCPLHGWTYDLSGELIGAPHFDPCPKTSLRNFSTQQWNGIVFEKGTFNLSEDLKTMRLSDRFNFDHYTFHSRNIHECNYNWKTFIEVYLDDYHVDPFHPGLGSFVDCNVLDWQFGERYSIQSVGIKNKLKTPGTQVYKNWHQVLLDYRKGSVPEFGAIWLTIYPNVMVEWYPEVLVISSVWPKSPQKTMNIVDFYYPEEICHFEQEFVEAHKAAYMETCYEDDEIAERMDQGRRHLNQIHFNDVGPVHDPMEKGLEYFYKYYDKFIFSDWKIRQ
jgi:choline monooxygenase